MSETQELIRQQIEIGPMKNFVYVVSSASTREVALVDPAWDIDGLLGHVQEAATSLLRRWSLTITPTIAAALCVATDSRCC